MVGRFCFRNQHTFWKGLFFFKKNEKKGDRSCNLGNIYNISCCVYPIYNCLIIIQLYINIKHHLLSTYDSYPEFLVSSRRKLEVLHFQLRKKKEQNKYCHLSHEKNTGCLIGFLGILTMVYYNPHIPGKYNPVYALNLRFFFIAHLDWNSSNCDSSSLLEFVILSDSFGFQLWLQYLVFLPSLLNPCFSPVSLPSSPLPVSYWGIGRSPWWK